MHIVSKIYEFKATHSVDTIPGCDEQHEHNYRFRVFIRGEVTAQRIVADFNLIDKVGEDLVRMLDGQNLNMFVTVPTAEDVASLMQQFFQQAFPLLDVKIRLYETERAYAETEWS